MLLAVQFHGQLITYRPEAINNKQDDFTSRPHNFPTTDFPVPVFVEKVAFHFWPRPPQEEIQRSL